MRRAGGKGGWSLRMLGMNEMVVGLRRANPTCVTFARWIKSSRSLSSGALRSLDGFVFRAERFCDGRDRCSGFDGGGTGHVGYQHLPVLLRRTQVRVGLDERFLLHG